MFQESSQPNRPQEKKEKSLLTLLLEKLHTFAADHGYTTPDGHADNKAFVKDCHEGKADPNACKEYEALADELQKAVFDSVQAQKKPEENMKKAA